MIEKYIDSFFDELEVFDDLAKGRSNKAYLKGSIMEFLGDGNRENAMNVYVSFFDSYRIVLEGESNQFIDSWTCSGIMKKRRRPCLTGTGTTMCIP